LLTATAKWQARVIDLETTLKDSGELAVIQPTEAAPEALAPIVNMILLEERSRSPAWKNILSIVGALLFELEVNIPLIFTGTSPQTLQNVAVDRAATVKENLGDTGYGPQRELPIGMTDLIVELSPRSGVTS
jgi:hypothetical protein